MQEFELENYNLVDVMNKYVSFEIFWKHYKNRSIPDRQKYLCSLTRRERSELIHSFFKQGWDKLIAQNFIDESLARWKEKYGIDLIDMRIKSIKHNKIHLVDKKIWDEIESTIYEMKSFYNTDILFGGLLVSNWGTHNQFYKIYANRSNF